MTKKRKALLYEEGAYECLFIYPLKHNFPYILSRVVKKQAAASVPKNDIISKCPLICMYKPVC